MRSFLSRRAELDPGARARVAAELARRLEPVVVGPDRARGDEAFLEQVLAGPGGPGPLAASPALARVAGFGAEPGVGRSGPALPPDADRSPEEAPWPRPPRTCVPPPTRCAPPPVASTWTSVRWPRRATTGPGRDRRPPRYRRAATDVEARGRGVTSGLRRIAERLEATAAEVERARGGGPGRAEEARPSAAAAGPARTSSDRPTVAGPGPTPAAAWWPVRGPAALGRPARGRGW